MEDYPGESNNWGAKLNNFVYLFFPYGGPEQAEFAETPEKWIQTSECNKKCLYTMVCQNYSMLLSGGTTSISFDRENYILFPKSD